MIYYSNMQNSALPLELSITHTIKDIPVSGWEDLFGKESIEGYGYHKTLEESGLKEFSFGYLLGKRNGVLTAIIPFFCMEFSFDTLIRPPFHKLSLMFKPFLKCKLLFIGTPTTEELSLGISKNEDLDYFLDNALKKLYEFSKSERINGILFYNLPEKDENISGYLRKNNFIKMRSLPSTVIEINTDSLDNYINNLSKNTRKDLKRKLKKSQKLVRLVTELREDISDVYQEIYKLYLNNFLDSEVHFEVLTAEFFRDISKNMRGVAKYFITYDEKKIVAFNLCLVKGNTCIDKFIGLDLNVAHKYHLYFTTFCHNIDWCIKNGLRFYQTGTTDYYPKLRLGAKLIPLYIYGRMFNPLLNLIIRLSVRFIEPTNLDPSLKRSGLA